MENGIELAAPLSANLNDKGTAFAGSIAEITEGERDRMLQELETCGQIRIKSSILTASFAVMISPT
ncbi:MAG: hypothetical protein V5783_06185 [Pontiella sp.]